MNLLDYIKGNRRGKDAHRLEKGSMRDSFLSEAIDGYDSVADDHITRIENIQAQLKAKSGNKNKKHSFTWILAAACTIGVLVAGGYILLDKPQSMQHAHEMAVEIPSEVIDIYVPTAFYEGHKEVIEDKNIVLHDTESTLSGAGYNINIETENAPIRIYVPGEYYEENKETIQKAEEVFPRHNG